MLLLRKYVFILLELINFCWEWLLDMIIFTNLYVKHLLVGEKILSLSIYRNGTVTKLYDFDSILSIFLYLISYRKTNFKNLISVNQLSEIFTNFDDIAVISYISRDLIELNYILDINS